MKEHKRIDSEYVIRYQKNPNDLDAFNQIFNFYNHGLYYFSYSYLKNRDDAEEVVQETFIKIVKNIHSLRDPDSFHTWLFKICYSNIMLHYRKEVRYQNMDDVINMNEIQDVKKSQKTVYKEKELLHAVEDTIEELNERFKSVAVLYYLDEMKIAEISKILEIPEGTVKTRLMKVRGMLKERLDEKGISPNAYLSIGFTPLVIQAFQELSRAQEMSAVQSQIILEKVQEIMVPLSMAGTVSGGVATASTSIYKKAIISIAAALATTAATYTLLKPTNVIDEIAYFDDPTDKLVEVQVLLNESVDKSDIQVKRDSEVIDIEMSNKKIQFNAEENGTYIIQVKNNSKEIEISNIDRNAPSAELKEYYKDYIQLSINDDIAGINYETSYAEYKGEKYPISNDGKISGNFDTAVKVYLYDNVGNFSEYTITINKG